MTTVYRVFVCGKCRGRTYDPSSLMQPVNQPIWCANCATVTPHLYEGIETA